MFDNKTKNFVRNLVFGEKLFGLLKWDRKTIRTSLQSLVRGERANLKRDQENLDHNDLIVVESVPEHTE
jgi:hypothetical protein